MDSAGPLPIRRLQESLINRIAAGEIIHRPASALKELLENSLDAGSTSIRVTVKDGGMKLLQIQDNGSGIRKADLPILAERFTTSKISNFSDLSSLSTYGFRGEALASISHVAQLTVVTKTKEDTCAWKACYSDGKLVPSQAGQTDQPKPCAGNDGTTLTIENLFYNTPTRLAALRSTSEELARILDVITKYAVHNPHVAFLCKKASSPAPALSTPSASTTPQAIRMLYGHSIAKELVEARIVGADGKRRGGSRKEKSRFRGRHEEDGDEDEEEEEEDEDPGDKDPEENQWTADAHFTSANYQAKKTVFLLFINHRLVESPRLKRALEAVYTGVLPKGTCPFIYLSLLLPPKTIDVNVHPTKSTVHFLNEDAIIERIADEVQRVLVERSGKSRGFDVGKQTLLTITKEGEGSGRKRKGRDREADEEDEEEEEEGEEGGKGSGKAGEGPSPSSSTSRVKPHVYSHHKVRTSLKDRTLDSMFPVINPSQIDTADRSRDKGKGKAKEIVDVDTYDPAEDSRGGVTRSGSGGKFVGRKASEEIKESECFLTSVVALRERVKKGKHKHLTEILTQHTFVGIVDLDKCLSLIQYSTKLFLVNHAAFAEELFYQLALRQFGDMTKIKLQPPPPLKRLIEIAVEAEDIPEERNGVKALSKDQIVDRITEMLITRREMLSEYFSLTISASGEVMSIPLLLHGYTPNLDKLPCFLMRLGPQVDWTSETECFDTFLRELAYFYVPGPGPLGSTAPLPFEDEFTPDERAEEIALREQETKAERWQIQHILFPSFRRYLLAPKSLLDGKEVVQVANLPDLYKVFERC